MTDPRRQMRLMKELFDTVRVEKFSDDYAARVTVAPGGGIDDITVTGRASAYNGAEIGALVFELLRAARAELDAELAAKMTEAFGAGAGAGSPFESLPGVEALRTRIDRAREEGR